MRITWAIPLLTAIVLSVTTTPSLAVDMGIVTGSEKGTYYQFGLNLQKLVKPHDINLNVSTSTGSVENIYAVFQRPATQLGIVQSDVLAFVSRVEIGRASCRERV